MHRHDVHVDPIEAQEVVRLAAERQSAVTDTGPTVNGLAEALGLPREEVERLLAEVRGQRGVATVPKRRRIFGDRSAALSAALALMLFVFTAAGLFYFRAQRAAAPPRFEALVGPGFVPDESPDVIMPPVLAPPAPTEAPDTIIIESGEVKKRQEIERLAEEIAHLQAELDRLKKAKTSVGQ